MTENGNIIITRTITTANPREYFINGIHLKTVAGMLKIFELIFATIAIYAIAVYIHDYGRLNLVEVHWKPRDHEHESIQYSRPLDELDLFLLMTPIICFISILCLMLFSALSRNKKLIAQNGFIGHLIVALLLIIASVIAWNYFQYHNVAPIIFFINFLLNMVSALLALFSQRY